MVPKILTFGAGQNGKKIRIWFRFFYIWYTILQMVPFYIWCRNRRHLEKCQIIEYKRGVLLVYKNYLKHFRVKII